MRSEFDSSVSQKIKKGEKMENIYSFIQNYNCGNSKINLKIQNSYLNYEFIDENKYMSSIWIEHW